MKKLILILSLIGIAFTSNAQITVTDTIQNESGQWIDNTRIHYTYVGYDVESDITHIKWGLWVDDACQASGCKTAITQEVTVVSGNHKCDSDATLYGYIKTDAVANQQSYFNRTGLIADEFVLD